MNERPPQSKEEAYAILKKDIDEGLELQKQDREDPIRGPIVRKVYAVYSAGLLDTGKLNEEFTAFRDSFPDRFENPEEARRYRLYHVLIGSTPPGNTDLFDAEGDRSIALAMGKLGEKYGID